MICVYQSVCPVLRFFTYWCDLSYFDQIHLKKRDRSSRCTRLGNHSCKKVNCLELHQEWHNFLKHIHSHVINEKLQYKHKNSALHSLSSKHISHQTKKWQINKHLHLTAYHLQQSACCPTKYQVPKVVKNCVAAVETRQLKHADDIQLGPIFHLLLNRPIF